MLDRINFSGPGDVWGENGYVYVAARSGSGFYVIDARDPTNMRQVARVTRGGFCQEDCYQRPAILVPFIVLGSWPNTKRQLPLDQQGIG